MARPPSAAQSPLPHLRNEHGRATACPYGEFDFPLMNIFSGQQCLKSRHAVLTDNTLVTLMLMIAESRTEEKDVMVKVVVNLINQKNE